MKEGPHHPHAHSHRHRRRGRRIWTEEELISHLDRVERRRERVAAGPQPVRVQAVVKVLEMDPAGQRKGRMDQVPRGPSRFVTEALARQAAARAAARR